MHINKPLNFEIQHIFFILIMLAKVHDSNPQQDIETLLGGDTIKSRSRIISIALCASISALMFGYSLKEITSIPIDTIAANYGMTIDYHLLQGLLIAIMPFGGLFGSLIAKSMLKSITRLKGMHMTLPVLVISILIVQITTPLTLFVGRFIEGMCIGYYVSIAPIYLKQISPKQLRSVTGTFFGLGKIAGVLTVIILELMLGENAWRFLLSVTAILALIQSSILAVIGLDTPYEWIARGDIDKARESVQEIYHKEEVEDILEEMRRDYKLEQAKSQTNLDSQENQIFKRKKRTAFQVALNVCIVRHFSGGNSLITSAGIIMGEYSKELAKWTPLVINSTQFIALIAYVLFFSSSFGKRFLIVYASGLLALLNVALIYSLIMESEVGILVSIMGFMIIYGGMLLSAVWSYPSEIIPAAESLIPNIVHWVALSLSTLAPSLVMSLMPHDQVYPCFLFFFSYTFLAFLYFKENVVESNGLAYQEIIQKFNQ